MVLLTSAGLKKKKKSCIGYNDRNGYSVQGLVAKVKDTVTNFNGEQIWPVRREPLNVYCWDIPLEFYISVINFLSFLSLVRRLFSPLLGSRR